MSEQRPLYAITLLAKYEPDYIWIGIGDDGVGYITTYELVQDRPELFQGRYSIIPVSSGVREYMIFGGTGDIQKVLIEKRRIENYVIRFGLVADRNIIIVDPDSVHKVEV